MPCPELCCLGLDRGNILGAESPVVVENTRIRKEIQRAGLLDWEFILFFLICLEIMRSR